MPERRGRTGPMNTPGACARARTLAHRAGSGAGSRVKDSQARAVLSCLDGAPMSDGRGR
jgi:hypothetical protein